MDVRVLQVRKRGGQVPHRCTLLVGGDERVEGIDRPGLQIDLNRYGP